MTFSSIEESAAWGAGYDAANAGVLKLVATAELLERKRIIALIERRICFDALEDPDGRCSNHGGKCYDLRELINKLKKESK